MKLIIQIPCFNEAKSLPDTLRDLPRVVPGFTSVQWLVINDGSTDETSEIARAGGVDHLLDLPRNQGLATAFAIGLQTCLKLGADVIVNTDADNQYSAGDIPLLIKPILEGQADIVIGARPIRHIPHFSFTKKILQLFGSMSVRFISRTRVTDAPSGFRAFSRSAAAKLNFFTGYSHTLETILQAEKKRLNIVSIPIRVNPEARPSRLVKSTPHYIYNSLITIVHVFVIYNPFRFFGILGSLSIASGLIICVRFLFLLLHGSGNGHVQSLILASILLLAGLLGILVAFITEIISVNRLLLEDIQYKLRLTESFPLPREEYRGD